MSSERLLTTDLLHLQAESRLRTHICSKSPQTCEGPGQQLLKPGSESVGVQIMNCGAVLDAVTCRCPQAVYNNKHKAARTTSFTASTKPSRCHRHNQNQDIRSEEHQVEPQVWSYLTQETAPCSPTSGPHRTYWRWRWACTESRNRQLPAGGAVIQTGPHSRIGSYLTPQRADNWARGTSQK